MAKEGAYQLRALYQRHVTRVLVIATVIFALVITAVGLGGMQAISQAPAAVTNGGRRGRVAGRKQPWPPRMRR